MAKVVKKNSAIKSSAKTVSKGTTKPIAKSGKLVAKPNTNQSAAKSIALKKVSPNLKDKSNSGGEKKDSQISKVGVRKGISKPGPVESPSKSLRASKGPGSQPKILGSENFETKSTQEEESKGIGKTPIQNAMKKLSEKASKQKTPKENAQSDVVAEVESKATKPNGKKAKSGIKIVGKVDVGSGDSVDKLTKKWANLYKKAQNTEALPYNMANSYESNVAIEHKIHGWGFILENRNDRLEVLFQSGIKYLISNYKS